MYSRIAPQEGSGSGRWPVNGPRPKVENLVIALLFFGPQKLPELGKGLAQGIRSFKDSLKEANPEDPGHKG